MSPAGGHLGFSISPKRNNTWLASCNDHNGVSFFHFESIVHLNFLSHLTTEGNGTKRGRNVHLHGLTKSCNYVPRWWPSWIFNQSKKEQHLVSILQWSFMTIFNSILYVVSEKKIFEISANQKLLWPPKCCYFLDRLKIQDSHQRGT
jgi:hypothetical protein